MLYDFGCGDVGEGGVCDVDVVDYGVFEVVDEYYVWVVGVGDVVYVDVVDDGFVWVFGVFFVEEVDGEYGFGDVIDFDVVYVDVF